MALANSNFIFQPPDNDPTCCCNLSSGKPTSFKACSISSRPTLANSGSRPIKLTKSISASDPCNLCSTKHVFNSSAVGKPSN